jgi:GNAT superfamily N-acetyltransferase
MSAVTVRRAVFEDARTIAEFAVRLFAQHRAYDSRGFAQIASIEGAERFYRNQTKAKDAAVLVAETNGKIIGFAYLQFERTNYAGLLENAAWLHDLYVTESARGQNAGRLLIENQPKSLKNSALTN